MVAKSNFFCLKIYCLLMRLTSSAEDSLLRQQTRKPLMCTRAQLIVYNEAQFEELLMQLWMTALRFCSMLRGLTWLSLVYWLAVLNGASAVET